MLRVAVVGSGPSGIYAAESLLKARPGEVRVDVFDRLPAPFGLVRYGVAPDHPKIKSITKALHRTFEDPAIRFLGDVEVGVAPTVEQLRAHYDAVVYAFGAARDRRLEVPGEDLPGSLSAVEFVAWYSGHPDAALDAALLRAESAVVVGAGNVALDVARLLVRSTEDLARTDLPTHVLDVLAASDVRDVHLLARRGPAQVKFTTKELRELGEVSGVDVLVEAADLELDPVSAALAETEREAARNVAVLREYAHRPPSGAERRLHLHFWRAPVEVCGPLRVTGVRCDQTALDPDGRLRVVRPTAVLPAQLVLRSVGYRGAALPGVPLDPDRGVIPNEGGRVLRDGAVSPGEYVAGWIKRGPTGVIGTNRSDAAETVRALLADLPEGRGVDGEVPGLPAETLVDWDGWLAIDAAEERAGEPYARGRVKLAHWAELRAAALGRHARAPEPPDD